MKDLKLNQFLIHFLKMTLKSGQMNTIFLSVQNITAKMVPPLSSECESNSFELNGLIFLQAKIAKIANCFCE